MAGSDAVWQALRAKLRQMRSDDAGVKVGVFQSAGEAPGGDISMVELAAIHEFGSPAAGIPERSFLRSTFRARRDDLRLVSEKIARGVVSDAVTLRQGLEVLGQWGVAAVRRAITDGDGIPPPNAPSTIARKHSSRPLVDTGRLLASITHEVVGADAAPAPAGSEGTPLTDEGGAP